MKCFPNFGQRALEFSGVEAQFGGGADEPFMSEIGALLPMAHCDQDARKIEPLRSSDPMLGRQRADPEEKRGPVNDVNAEEKPEAQYP
ncbi:hypothetical protein RHSP_83324 [Rhizobium freirei PRF 81]|uniref:Uncharacterized protein n=1 Tax=Rhizobium freirei PRF 81 TaxID=363754 RepID=N6U854_9HYPH|nr:hypothetical protein RHSP_83324 [Rhizobium freirei PRF 81]